MSVSLNSASLCGIGLSRWLRLDHGVWVGPLRWPCQKKIGLDGSFSSSCPPRPSGLRFPTCLGYGLIGTKKNLTAFQYCRPVFASLPSVSLVLFSSLSSAMPKVLRVALLPPFSSETLDGPVVLCANILHQGLFQLEVYIEHTL